LDFGGKNELAVLFREKDFLIMRIVKSKINCYITYMGQKGFVNIIMVIIGVIVFAGAAGYFIVRQRTPSPAAVLSPNQNLTSTPALTSTPTPESSSTPKLTSIPTSTLILTCDGISNTLKAELDGRLVESFNLVTDSDAYETVNGGESFDLIAAAQTDNNREKEIFIGALALSRGVQNPMQARFHIEYREYDKSTTPYTQKVLFTPKTMTGRVETRAVAVNSGEYVCGSFDVTGTGVHTIHVAGSFNQVLPPPRTGSQ